MTSLEDMDTSTGCTSPAATQVSREPAARPWSGVLTALTGAGSTQVGAAIGAQAFTAIGPAGVVAVRQLVAAAVLLPVARPRVRSLTWSQWWPVLLLAAVFATMNLSLYSAVEWVGLALAVTLEFLGPLAVALVASRGRRDGATAALAAVGVYVLVLPGPASDLTGIGLGLAAAACWAGYIVVNRLVGTRLDGLQAPALASGLCALGYLPVLLLTTTAASWTLPTVVRSVATGLLSSVAPYAADLTALRTVPPRLFGVLSSAQPVVAALTGLLLLGQHLDVHEWVGMGVVVTANVLAVTGAAGHRRG